jgi:hypothetical protein
MARRGVGHVGSVSRDEGNYLAPTNCHEPGAVSHPILSNPILAGGQGRSGQGPVYGAGYVHR